MQQLDPRVSMSGMSRRDILKAQALVGLGLAGLAFTDVQAQVRIDPVTGVRSNKPPQKGGTLIRSLPGDPPNFDPMSNTTSRVIHVLGACCNGLVRFGEYTPDTVVPDLAESWDVSPDGLAYTFRLRKGVKFHDGTPFTSADAKFTFDVLRNPPAGYISIRSGLLDAVDSIEAPDAHTLRFLLRRRSPALLNNLAGGWMVVLPKHILEKGPMKDRIVGTGPFKLKEYKRGTSIELVKNADYHVPDRPYLDGIRIFFIPDANTEFNYFRNGQLDMVGTSSATMALQWASAMAKTDYLLAGTTLSTMAVHFNTENKPWNDIRVRQAASLAIDRESALKTLMRGEGTVAGSTVPGPWALPKAELEKIPGYAPYSAANLVKAKKLLAEAGFPNGFKETMLVRRIDLFTPFAIFLKDQLAKVNIDLTLDLQETAAYNQTVNTGRYRVIAGARSYNANDPDAMYGSMVTCNGGANLSKLCDAKIDALVEQQSQELDPVKRRALTHQLERASLANYGSYMVFFRHQYRIYHANLHNWPQHPNEDNSARMEDCWKSS